MTRRKMTPAQAEELTVAQCLLCGADAQVAFEDATVVVRWELCATCNTVFVDLAQRVAGAAPLVVAGPAAAVLEHVAGQLELDDEDGPAAFGLSDLDVATVQSALRSGDFDGIDTLTVARFRDAGLAGSLEPWDRRHPDESAADVWAPLPFSRADNDALRRVLQRRA